MEKTRILLRRISLLILAATFCAAAAGVARGALRQANAGAAEFSLQYRVRRGRSETPRTDVFLVVRGRRVLIRPNVIGEFRTLERTEYAERKVPAAAVAACTGWWAGQGEDVYVIRRGSRLAVYVRELDESAADSAYRQRKVIPLPRR